MTAMQLLVDQLPDDWSLTAIDWPPYRLDFSRREVAVAGRPMELAPREFDLA